MKKGLKFLLILIAIMNIYSVNIFAAEVYLRVEGVNKTIMEGNVEADVFVKALQKLGQECDIEVIMKNSNEGQKLFSINNIENNAYGLRTGWKFYIIRNSSIIDVNDINNTTIINGDKLVAYYGDNETTKKISDIKQSYSNGKLELEFISSVTTWIEKDNVWKPETINNTLENVSVHLLTGNKKIITKKADTNGKVNFELASPNICVYYADGYKDEGVPTIVKTDTIKDIIGINKSKNLTRAELIAILINYFEIDVNKEAENRSFPDVTDDTLYKEQIYIAASNSIVNGDENSCFNPDNEITMQELAVILCKIYENKQDTVQSNELQLYLGNYSPWAESFIKSVIQKDIIKDIPDDWLQPVTTDIILSLKL